MEIANNLNLITSSIPDHVTLVAVSKTKPKEDLMEAYQAGQRVFGENKVQELTQKHQDLPKDIQWHMIGHLQSNKVKYIAPFVSLIHGVDTFKLLKEINKQGKKNDRQIRVLLQVHIAQESSKFGFSAQEIVEILSSRDFIELKHIEICGVMGMATNTPQKEVIAKEFQGLKNTFDHLKQTFFSQQQSFQEISMGMSGDYKIGIENGSSMIRVGSAIFGKRNYQI